MKNIKNFIAEKYKNNPEYTAVAEDIYQMGNEYVTSFSFEPEPEIGEEKIGGLFAPYLLEDLLDTYSLYISDFYDALNKNNEQECFFEVAGDLEEVKQCREIIGKHVYHQTIDEDGEEYITLTIE
jgi:hypothetical protein